VSTRFVSSAQKLVSWVLVSWALVSWAAKKTRFVSTRFVSTRFVSKKKNSFREHSFREQLEKLVSWAVSRVSWAKVLTRLLTRIIFMKRSSENTKHRCCRLAICQIIKTSGLKIPKNLSKSLFFGGGNQFLLNGYRTGLCYDVFPNLFYHYLASNQNVVFTFFK